MAKSPVSTGDFLWTTFSFLVLEAEYILNSISWMKRIFNASDTDISNFKWLLLNYRDLQLNYKMRPENYIKAVLINFLNSSKIFKNTIRINFWTVAGNYLVEVKDKEGKFLSRGRKWGFNADYMLFF